MRFLIIALLLAGAYFILRSLYRQSPQLMYRWLGIIAGAGLIALVITGRAHWLAAVAGAILPFLGKAMLVLRWLPFLPLLRRVLGGNTMRLKTAWLKVTMDRATGALDGAVLQGEFKGRQLGQLSIPELQQLLQACSSDPQSVSLLRAYLQRCRSDWQESSSTGSRASDDDGFASGTMSVDTAARILGIPPHASNDDIRDAHRRLMQKLHPDRGGNDYLTQKINQARDTLLH